MTEVNLEREPGRETALDRLHGKVQARMNLMAALAPHCEAVDALDWVLQRIDEELGS